MRTFVFCTPHQYHSDDQIKRNEMGGHVASIGVGRDA